MRYFPDRSGRLPLRVFIPQNELDAECEKIITVFMLERYGTISLPVPTDLLTMLLERDAADLDLYADLSDTPDVEAVTEFIPGSKPFVRISKELSGERWRENRLRTTLSHEYGHVYFHDPLVQIDARDLGFPLFDHEGTSRAIHCHRNSILEQSKIDWMEWQASYASGAFLMPASTVRKQASEFVRARGIATGINAISDLAHDLIEEVAVHFAVSRDAAKIRAFQLALISKGEPSLSLFE